MPTTSPQSHLFQIIIGISIGIVIGFGAYIIIQYNSAFSWLLQDTHTDGEQNTYHHVALAPSAQNIDIEGETKEDTVTANLPDSIVGTEEISIVTTNEEAVVQNTSGNTTGNEFLTGEDTGTTYSVSPGLSIQEQELTRYYINILEQDPSFKKLIDLPIVVSPYPIAFQTPESLESFHKEFKKNASEDNNNIVLIVLDELDLPYWHSNVGTGNSGDLLFTTRNQIIRAGKNTLVVLKHSDDQWEAQALQIILPQGEEFSKNIQKTCIQDICIDTQYSHQQESDGAWTQTLKDKTVTLLPGKYAQVTKTSNGGTKSLRIIQLGNNSVKQSTIVNSKGITALFHQEAIDRVGNPSDFKGIFAIPQQVRYGNLILTSPTFSFQQSKSSLTIPVQSVSEFTMRLAQWIEGKQFITDQVMFQLPQGILVAYKLSKNTYDTFDYSWTTEGSLQSNAFKIIPKTAQRMNKPESYAIIDEKQDDLIEQTYGDKSNSIEFGDQCVHPERFENIDHGARFALYPVNTQRDLISLVNCFQYKGQ